MPEAPSALHVSDVTKTALTLTWEPPYGDDTVSGYLIEKRQADSDKWEQITRVPGKVRSHHMTGLKPGETLIFRVSAENPAGVSAPAELPVAVELKGKKGKIKCKYTPPLSNQYILHVVHFSHFTSHLRCEAVLIIVYYCM